MAKIEAENQFLNPEKVNKFCATNGQGNSW